MFGEQVKHTLIAKCKSYLGEEATEDNLTCGMVLTIPQEKLESLFGSEKGTYLYRMCNGIQEEKVQSRSETKTLSSGKTFFNHRTLTTLTDVNILTLLHLCF
jgi:nucleotidyltransferase/DNA polymerase involved in DNA repair